MYAFTAAHKTLPLPSFARVTNLDNGRSVIVRVNDRGPFHPGRVIDLSYAAAVKLGYRDRGTARVEVRGLGPGESAREPHDAVAGRAAATPPAPPMRHASAGPAPATGLDRLVGALPGAGADAATPALQARSATAAAGATPAVSPGGDWRFDMRQDGKAMTADEFDAWMRSRRARVATGRPGRPDPAPASPVANPGRAIVPVAPPPPSPVTAAAVVAATSPEQGRVTLQVASFANQQNASHALAMLRDADIASARLLDASVNGQKVWRLRIGPVDAATAPELAARVVGLGFGQPQRVRD
jgi:rare lipoprotein A